jgi:hypothetical protein
VNEYVAYFDFCDGSDLGPIDLSSVLLYERLCDDNYGPATNYCRITLQFNAILLARRTAQTGDIYCRIIADGEPFFYGRIAPTDHYISSGASVDGHSDISDFDFEVEDFSALLERDITEDDAICWENHYVCNPAEPQLSIYHRLLGLCGLPYQVMDPGEQELTILRAFAVSEGTVRDVLAHLLFEYGLVHRFNKDGNATLFRWLIQTPESAMNIDENIIMTGLDVERMDRDADGANVVWYPLKDKNDALIYMADLPFGDNGLRSGYPIQPGLFWPEEANVDETWWDYQDTALSKKLQGSLTVKNSDFTQLVLTKNHRIDARVDDGVIQAFDPVFKNLRARVAYQHAATSPLNIYYCNIYADVVYRSAKNEIEKSNIANPKKIKPYEAAYIHDELTAALLACALADGYTLGRWRYSFHSENKIPLGLRGNLHDPYSGMSVLTLIIERVYDVNTEIYKYKAISIGPVTIESIVKTTHAIPAPINQNPEPTPIIVINEIINVIDTELTKTKEDIQRVRAGDIVDGAIARAALEAGFVEEHEKSISELWPSGLESPSAVDVETAARLAEVAVERERLDFLEPEIFPYGPEAPSAPEIIAGDLLSVGALAEILEREIAGRDQGLVMAEQRILLIAQDTAGALEKVASLEITVEEIEAIVAEFSGDHTRIAALEIQAAGIEASVADYDSEKAKIASLQLTVDSINSVLAELSVGGEIINLSLVIQNADRIAQIVADGGYTDAESVFHPTKAYTQVTQLSDRYELFLAGDDTEKAQAAWIATVDQISSFVTALEVAGEIEGALAPVEAAVSAIEQRADAIELSVAEVAGSIDQVALETRETLLAALDQLEAQASSSIILTQNRIDLVVARQDGENVSLWARIALEADRITSEVGRAAGAEVDLSSRITQEAGRISQEIEDRAQGLLNARSYIDQTATSILSSVESDMQALDGVLRQVASAEAAAAQAAASAYADGIVTDEEQRAIADAQAKADAARAAAISTAAADASAKAIAAREAAETYAFARAEEAAAAAAAYADGIVTEEEQRAIADAQAKADAAELAATTAAASYTDSQILQLNNAIIARVEQTEIALDPQEDGSVAYRAAAAWAQLLLEPGTFATRIQASEDGIIQNGSLIEQVKDLIAFRVDQALSDSMAGIVIAGNRIDLAVAEQRSSAESLLAQLTIEAERITSEVLRATDGESSLSSQIVQQAGQIAARVRASQFNPEDGTWSDVQAIMALTVTLPNVISQDRHDAIRALLAAADRPLFDAVYEQYLAPWSEDGGQTWESDVRYQISPTATTEDLAALRSAMSAVGALSSQFLVDADEVLVPGTIRGRHLEMESVSTEIFTAISARIQELSAKRVFIDTDPGLKTDFEVYIDEDHGILVKKNNTVILSVNPDTGRVYLYGDADIEDGIFRGSIESGPLILNKNPPTSASKMISGSLITFLQELKAETGLHTGTFQCSGTYDGVQIGKISINLVESIQTYETTRKLGYWWDFSVYHYSWFKFTRSKTTYNGSIVLYRADNGEVLYTASDAYSPDSNWTVSEDLSFTSSNYQSWPNEGYPANEPASGGTVSFPASGSLSFTSTAFTYKLLNLPSGYSSAYPTGTVYIGTDGALKIKT